MFAGALRRLTRLAFRKGSAGSRVWIVIGVAATGVRLLRWLARDEPEVLYRTAIRDGDLFEIVTRAPPGR